MHPAPRLLLALIFAASSVHAALERRAIQDGWEFRQVVPAPSSPAPWRPATVPGCVHLDLLHSGLIPDPFYRDNESRLQWIEAADWEYRAPLEVTAAELARSHVELVFTGLDAACDVFVNGTHVLAANDMFRIWRVDVRGALHAGTNQLRIVFPAPAKAAHAAAASDPWQAKIGTEDKTYVRKAAYEYGWDWGPRFVTSGVWRPVYLETWDHARLADWHIRQRDVSAAVAHLSAEAEVEADADASATFTVSYVQAGHPVRLSQSVLLHPGRNELEMPVEIAAPERWFPNGYGPHPLYTFEAGLTVDGALADVRTVRTGLRSVELRREPDEWGRSFTFVINGIPVFAKGANVIPFDSFPTRVTEAQYRRVLGSAQACHMNMVRHWGGGYYETDTFYNLCDEMGIMVWEEFMFGNDWQPGTYAQRETVAREAEDQIRRLRNHPAIVLWCGNNETEAAYQWQIGKMHISDADTQSQMWKSYLLLFHATLGQAVARFAPETPYWPSSPSSDFEPSTEAYRTGDFHDWSVWHGGVPFTDYEKHVYRFVSEYGFQSFPELRTVEAFTRPADRTSIFTPVMLAHQKNNEGNSIIHDTLLRDYAEPKDFASFLYVSQVLQAEGMKIGTEHWRRHRPETMGALFWQLNDCWPVASWSSIDYYGRWKALQYYARRFFAPVLVSPHVADGAVQVAIVSDRTQPVRGTLQVRILTLGGRTLRVSDVPVTIPALSSAVYASLPLTELAALGAPLETVFVRTSLKAEGEALSQNLVYVLPTAQVHLLRPAVSVEWVGEGDGRRVRLRSNVLARDVLLDFGAADAQPDDNYFDLVPGETVEVAVHGAHPENWPAALRVRTLWDAFPERPAAPSEPAASH